MFTYYLAQCSSVILPFLCEWKHLKVGTLNMLLPEEHLWTESIYFICTCKQVFNSALHPCVQFIQMMKYICQVCQRCTSLIACKQIWVIGPLISQKHTGVSTVPRDTNRTSVWSNKALCSLPFPHTKMQIYDFSKVMFLQSSLCAQHHPTQELVLLVKSLQRGPLDTKNSA